MTVSVAEDLLWKGHLRKIVEAILAGKAVPFLGSDVNLCDRPRTETGRAAPWTPKAPFPPSNQELASYLDLLSAGLGPAYHQEVSCPFVEHQGLEQLPSECPLRQGGVALRLPVHNVSQYVSAIKDGDTALYEALSGLFDKPYAPNSLHRFFAALPPLLRNRCKPVLYPLIVTACFDSALEQAFREAGEEIDLVTFIGKAQHGLFRHQAPDGTRHDITEPNTYPALDLAKRPVVLKLYGGYESQSFLITEDDYIDYLSHRDMAELIPSSLLRILRADDTNLWFLGYGLSSWNQRVILRRLWQEKLDQSDKAWWAIQSRSDPLDLRIWGRYSVQVPHRPYLRLEDYMAEVEERLEAAPSVATVHASDLAAPMPREGVFFSYSHEDKKWLEQIKEMLTPVIRSNLLREWDDTQIRPGAKWRDEIQAALQSAKVAVLLVSASFLKSEFIASEELPALLKAAENDGVIICPVLLEKCLYDYSSLKDYQAVNDLAKPLGSLTGAKRSEALDQIARKILDALHRK